MRKTPIYHATSASNAEKIINGELNSGSYITSCLRLAEYYAETVEDEGESAVILMFELSADATLEPDHAGICEPIMPVLRAEFDLNSEEDVLSEWELTDGTGWDCLDLIGSAVLMDTIQGASIRVI
ncbi:hypothetical protein [Stutzerimonas frequens]|uniref:hypothetical protein n=1 Tax=Stutzerimonas frequens TaxID=2968969 RepID=UPI001AAE9725|nr:hypothetical protein [Stutzerimonas frequens]QTF59122.1 hypothetical protein J4H94_20745 [Stutzerimonas frequens]